MKKLLKTLFVTSALLLSAASMTSCDQADVITHNIQQKNDYFNTYRKMTFINLYSDKILYTAEGYFSLQTTKSSEFMDPSEIALVFKIGEDEYKMDYFSIANNVTYVIEQIENTHSDPYYWEIKWYIPLPSIAGVGE